MLNCFRYQNLHDLLLIQLSQLTKLKELNLQNFFASKLDFTILENLEKIYLKGCIVKEVIILSEDSKLKHLDIDLEPFGWPGPFCILQLSNRFPKLENLMLSSRDLERFKLPQELPSLRHCSFKKCGLEEIKIPPSATELRSVEFVPSYRWNSITIPLFLTRKLNQIKLDGKSIDREGINKMRKDVEATQESSLDSSAFEFHFPSLKPFIILRWPK